MMDAYEEMQAALRGDEPPIAQSSAEGANLTVLERAAFDGLEHANREMVKQIEVSAPTCHFRKMVLEQSDSVDGNYEQWWECSVCGHTRAL